jgi:hypothetical protein
MSTPLFKRVLLAVEKLEETKDFFSEEETKKPKVTIINMADDCDLPKSAIGREVLFNGVINEVVEEDDKQKVVLTHETNLLMLV